MYPTISYRSLVRFTHSLAHLSLASRLQFTKLAYGSFFYNTRKIPPYFFRFCGSNGKTNLHVHFYVYARLKYHIPMMHIYSTFSFSLLPPACWMVFVHVDKSLGSAAVFGVRCFIRIPSLCRTLPVILREELSIN